ncbi:MAG: response regulator [Bacteroidales bacterium]|nr:response regulator [Bacteroidales bacterium]
MMKKKTVQIEKESQTDLKHNISVLYVEGDPSSRNIYQRILVKAVKNVYVASDGLEGLEMFRRFKPDVVLTDVRMEVISGLEMISKIRKEDKNVRIVIISAFSESHYFLSAISYGVKGYLLKPVQANDLLNLMVELANEILLDKKVSEEEEKRRQAEKSKERGEAILQVLAYATGVFFKEGFNSDSVYKVLGEIGLATRSSRVYIFQNFNDESGKPYTSQIYEWVKSSVKAEIDNPELFRIYFDSPVLTRWLEVMPSRGYIHGLIRDIPEGDEKEVLAAQDIVSLLAMPIFVENAWWGFIGLDDCENERIWSESEIKAMETLAGNLGAAIYRKQVESQLIDLNAGLEQRVKDRTRELEQEVVTRKEAQELLKESEEKYRLIYENANNGIILMIDEKIIMVNPEAVNIFGMKPKFIIGKLLSDFVHKKDKRTINNYLHDFMKSNDPASVDIRIITGEKSVKWLDIKSTEISWNKQQAYLLFISDITGRKTAEQEIKMLNKTLESRISEEIQKVKQQQQLLVQKSKLESMGELSAGLSHEINQPLSGISMGLENILLRMSETELVDTDYIKNKFSLLFRDVERINKIIQHVRIFSRDQQNTIMEKVDVVGVIRDALSMVEVQMKNHDIQVNIDLPDNPVYITGNHYRLEQVLLNLISNARYAMEEKEKQIAKGTYNKQIEIACVSSKNCIILIKDNGTGISKENINNIFDPFFTTKDEEKGTGLGLSISYGIIKEMKGKIEVESEEGNFTGFKIDLPLLKDEI